MFKNILIRILAGFIPIKQWRKDFRNYFLSSQKQRASNTRYDLYKSYRLYKSKQTCDLDIITSGKIYEKGLYAEELFIDYIKNKTIAVVGNGPGEIGKKKGAEIDSHDIVIRFNNFNTTTHCIDYGKKTTVWVRNNENLDRIPLIDVNSFDYIILHRKNESDHIVIRDMFLLLAFFLRINKRFFFINDKLISDKISYLNYVINKPSTGMIIIVYLFIHSKNIKSIKYYGFDFCSQVHSLGLHYSDEETQQEKEHIHAIEQSLKISGHNWEEEKKVFESILSHKAYWY